MICCCCHWLRSCRSFSALLTARTVGSGFLRGGGGLVGRSMCGAMCREYDSAGGCCGRFGISASCYSWSNSSNIYFCPGKSFFPASNIASCLCFTGSGAGCSGLRGSGRRSVHGSGSCMLVILSLGPGDKKVNPASTLLPSVFTPYITGDTFTYAVGRIVIVL